MTTLTPLAEALGLLLDGRAPVALERVPVTEALGLVAAKTVTAAAPVPPGTVALRAGIAVASGELVGASPYAPAFLTTAPATVAPGEALPPGCDAVLPADAAEILGTIVQIGQAAYPGEGAALAGSDVAPGAVIVAAGEAITPERALALALAGNGDILVRRPVVALPAGEAWPALDWLRSWLAGLGCRFGDNGGIGGSLLMRNVSGNAADELAPALDSRDEPRSDISLLFHVPSGIAPHVRGLALRPGDGTALALPTGKSPILIVPQRFDAIVAVAFALILPLVARLTARHIHHVALPLTAKITSTVGVADVALLRRTDRGYEPLAVGRIPLGALVAADAVAVLPPESEGAPAGSLLDAIPFREPLVP